MDMQEFLAKNSHIISEYEAEREADRLAAEKRAAEDRAHRRALNTALWLELGAEDAAISDDGEVTIGEWIVQAIRKRHHTGNTSIGVCILPANKDTEEWRMLDDAAAETEVLSGHYHSWVWSPPEKGPHIGEIAAYIAETLEKMPDIWREQVNAARAIIARTIVRKISQRGDLTLIERARRRSALTPIDLSRLAVIPLEDVLRILDGDQQPTPTQWADLRAALPELPKEFKR